MEIPCEARDNGITPTVSSLLLRYRRADVPIEIHQLCIHMTGDRDAGCGDAGLQFGYKGIVAGEGVGRIRRLCTGPAV